MEDTWAHHPDVLDYQYSGMEFQWRYIPDPILHVCTWFFFTGVYHLDEFV